MPRSGRLALCLYNINITKKERSQNAFIQTSRVEHYKTTIIYLKPKIVPIYHKAITQNVVKKRSKTTVPTFYVRIIISESILCNDKNNM